MSGLGTLGARLPDVQVVHHIDRHTWATRGRRLLVDGQPWSTFPRSWRDRVPGAVGSRLARADRCTVRPLPWGVLGLRAGWGYRLTAAGAERCWPVLGDGLRGAVTATDAAAWFGDYFANPRRAPVVIWRVDPDFRRRPAHVFPDGAVRHVHRVQVDPHDGALWATTGDRDGECWLWRSADGFRTVDRLGDGTQHSRATHLFFTPTHLAWCTDTETGTNHAVRLDRSTGALEVGQALPAPVWSGATTTDGWHLATTGVERGPGVRSRSAQVLASRDAWTWDVWASARKDGWPHRVGRHGLLHLPTGRYAAADAVVSGEALVGVDGCARRVPAPAPT